MCQNQEEKQTITPKLRADPLGEGGRWVGRAQGLRVCPLLEGTCRAPYGSLNSFLTSFIED